MFKGKSTGPFSNSGIQKYSLTQTGSTRSESRTEETQSAQLTRNQKGISASRTADESNTRTQPENKEIATSLTALREKCIMLKDYADVDKIKLRTKYPDIYKEFMYVVELGEKLIGTPEYETYMKIVGNIFKDSDGDERGTVGDFLYGCYRDPSIAGIPGCAPECAGNLPRHDSNVSHLCDHHVGIYKKRLVLHFSPELVNSSLLRIHSSSEKMKLSHEELHDLSKKGIENFQIYWNNSSAKGARAKSGESTTPSTKDANSKGSTVQSRSTAPSTTYNVKKLKDNIGEGGYASFQCDGAERFHQAREGRHHSSKRSEHHSSSSEHNSGGFGWAWIIFIFIFFIIIIFVFWYVCSRRGTTESCEKEVVNVVSHKTNRYSPNYKC